MIFRYYRSTVVIGCLLLLATSTLQNKVQLFLNHASTAGSVLAGSVLFYRDDVPSLAECVIECLNKDACMYIMRNTTTCTLIQFAPQQFSVPTKQELYVAQQRYNALPIGKR